MSWTRGKNIKMTCISLKNLCILIYNCRKEHVIVVHYVHRFWMVFMASVLIPFECVTRTLTYM